MKGLKITMLLLFLGSRVCLGQIEPKGEREVDAGIDVGVGVKGNAFSPSILYHEEAAFLGGKRFKAGVGIRAWGLYDGGENLVSQNNEAVRDTLKFGTISVNGASFVGGVSFKVWKMVLGANTDLFGLAFGSKRNGFYGKSVNSGGDSTSYYNKLVSASPTIINPVPLLFRRKTGQNEVFVRVYFTKNIGLKLGYLFTRVSYGTNKVDKKKVVLDNGQKYFSSFYGMPYAALSFSISN